MMAIPITQHRKFVLFGIDGHMYVVTGVVGNFNFPEKLKLGEYWYNVRWSYPSHWPDSTVLQKTRVKAVNTRDGFEMIPHVVPPQGL